MSRLAELSRELSESFTLGGGGYALKWKEQRIGKRRMELSRLILEEIENPSTGDEHIDEENKGGKLIDELESQIDDLKGKIKDLESNAPDIRIKVQKESITTLQKENDDLEDKVTDLEKAKVALIESGDARERYVLKLTGRLQEVEGRNEVMSETLIKGAKRIESLEDDLTEAGMLHEPKEGEDNATSTGPGETAEDSPGGSPSGD